MSSSGLVLFWKPPHPFSQWTTSAFEVDGDRYCCAEQYMMAEKAKLFGDFTSREQILATNDPKMHKTLGRLVANFDEAVWIQHREEVVLRASRAKFSQNAELKAFLLSTGDKELVEASPFDKIWGIGLAPDDPRAQHRSKWKGMNLLGKALMKVRTEFQTM